MKLNLGCGQAIKDGYVNVDIAAYKNVNWVTDLRVFPWPWTENSIEEICSNHFVEHIFDQERFFKECYRVLKKGGKLKINVPHVSNMRALGDMGHYRGYSVKTFDQYLCQPYYWFADPAFKTLSQKIVYMGASTSWWINVIYILTLPIEWCINLCPELYEKITCYYLGGAQAVEWVGEKL